MTTSGRRHLPELDGLRALAVLGVVAFHAVTTPAYHHLATPLQSIGARGVDLFFVLSGFCLSWPLSAAKMRTPGDFLTFVRRRVTRIAPTYYAALGLFAALAFTAFGLPDNPAPVPWAIQRDELVRDAMFFPTLLPIHDGPIWTLGIEMRWYVLFPFVLVLFYRTKIGFALAMLAAIVLNRQAGVYDFGFLPTFMLGIVAARLTRTEAKWHAVWPLAAIVAFALATNEQLHSLAIDHTSLYWAFGFFAAVLSVTTNPWLRRAFSWRPLVATGIASYSIYLVHMPFLDALAWCGVPAAMAAVASIGIGFAFWYAIERPLCSNVARAAMDRALVRLYRVVTFKRSGDVTPALTRAVESPAVPS